MKNSAHFIKSIATALTILLVFAIAAYFEFERFKQNERDTIATELQDIKSRTEIIINSRIWSAYGVRAFIVNRAIIDEKEIGHYLEQLFKDKDTIIRNLAILHGTTVAHIFPLLGNESALGTDLSKRQGQKESVLKVKNTLQTVITEPVQLVQGGTAVIARVPIVQNIKDRQVYWGQISVVLDYNRLIKAAGFTDYNEKRDFCVYRKEGLDSTRRLIFGVLAGDPLKNVKIFSNLHDAGWYFSAQPKGGWHYFSQFFVILIFAGICFSLAAGYYTYQFSRSVEFMAKSEEKFKTLFFNSPDANLIIANYRITDCNNATLNLLQVGREQLIGRTPWDISPEYQPDGELSEKKAMMMLQHISLESSRKFEWVHKRPDSSLLYVEVVLTQLLIGDNQVHYTTWRDIGERKKAENALRVINERLALISQVSSSIISKEPLANQVQRYAKLIHDAFKIDVCVIRIRQGEDLVLLTSTGIDADKIQENVRVGFGLSGYLMEGKKAMCINDMANHPLTNDYTYLIAGLHRGKSYAGAPILVKDEAIGVLSVYTIYEKMGFTETDLEHLQIIANNIAVVIENQSLYSNLAGKNNELKEELIERTRIEAELKVEKERAEELNRVKSYFFANMSHELRTPLQAILGYAQVLQQISIDDTQVRMAGIILQSGQRLSNTLKLILEISKLESEKTKPNIEPVDAKKLLSETMAFNKSTAIKKNLSLQLEFCEEDTLVEVDSALFIEVMNLIIDNAIKFTNSGGINVFINTENELVKIDIRDSGIGIAQSKLGLIFDEFRQESEGMGRSYEGTGLGLTLAKKYIELMNGVIRVESKVGEGTVFSVFFPRST